MQCKSKLMDIWAIANSNNFKEGMIDYKNNRNIPMHKENDFKYIYGRQYAASGYKTINYSDVIEFNCENLKPMMKAQIIFCLCSPIGRGVCLETEREKIALGLENA